MDRKVLLEALNRIKPALGREAIEELNCVWFDGETITAISGQAFGIQAPIVTPFKGGIKGALLLGLANNLKVKELELTADKENLVVKGGKTKATLALMPLEKMPANPPTKGEPWIAPTEFFAALGKVMISATYKRSGVPEQAGITILRIENGIYVVSTDAETIASTLTQNQQMLDGIKKEGRFTIPIPFVEELLDISKGTETEICIRKSSIWARNKKALLFSPLLGTDEPQNLVGVIKKVTKDCKYIPIPERLKMAVSRAEVMLESQKDTTVKVIAKDQVLRIVTTTQQGELKDNVALEESVPEVEINVDPKLIKRGLGRYSKIAFTPKAVVMANKGSVYLIAGS